MDLPWPRTPDRRDLKDHVEKRRSDPKLALLREGHRFLPVGNLSVKTGVEYRAGKNRYASKLELGEYRAGKNRYASKLELGEARLLSS